MKRIHTIIIASYCAIPVFAQVSNQDFEIVRNALDDMFENLDKTKVPTGLLLDYAVDLIEFSNYNGTELTDSNIVNTAVYWDILKSIRSAAVADKPFEETDVLMAEFKSSTSSVNISIAAFRYNFIKANALKDGLISYDESTEKVSDAYSNNVWCNPYSEDFIFAFAPSTDSKMSLSVTYQFSQTYSFSNLASFELFFDAGDGSGYRSVNLSSSVSVTYTDYGNKTIRLKLRCPEGNEYESHAIFTLKDPSNPNFAPAKITEPDEKKCIHYHLQRTNN